MVPFVDGDQDYDFWKQNPQLKTMSPFSELKNKKNSSEIMWAIYLWKDPKSIFNRIGTADRKEIVEKEYLKGKIKLDKYEKYADAYSEKCLSVKEKAYISWARQVEDFQEQYLSLPWDGTKERTMVKKQMMEAIPKMYDALSKAEAEAAEETRYRLDGGRIESIIESNDI